MLLIITKKVIKKYATKAIKTKFCMVSMLIDCQRVAVHFYTGTEPTVKVLDVGDIQLYFLIWLVWMETGSLRQTGARGAVFSGQL